MEVGCTQIVNVLHFNCFGCFPDGGILDKELRLQDNLPQDFEKSRQLFPAISMINHAAESNCATIPLLRGGRTRALALVVKEPIPIGAEVTITYDDDKEAVREKWGIEG